MPNTSKAGREVRYEPDERPSPLLSAGLGMQFACLCIASIVMTPTVMITVSGGSEAYLYWAVFSAIVICGFTTAVQARTVGSIGAGYILIMGSTSAFLAVCVSALDKADRECSLLSSSRLRRSSSVLRPRWRCCAGSSRRPWPAPC